MGIKFPKNGIRFDLTKSLVLASKKLEFFLSIKLPVLQKVLIIVINLYKNSIRNPAGPWNAKAQNPYLVRFP